MAEKTGEDQPQATYTTKDALFSLDADRPECVDFEPRPGVTLKLRRITDLAEWMKITRDAQLRQEMIEKSGACVLVGEGGKTEKIDDATLMRVFVLVHHVLAEPKLTLYELAQLSKKSGTLIAEIGAKVDELHGGGAVEEAKNGLGAGDMTPSPSPSASATSNATSKKPTDAATAKPTSTS